MSTPVRRRAAAVLLGALLLACLPVAAGANHINDHRTIILPDPAANGPTEWSLRWSAETFETATEVLIGRADDFPDSLASGALQRSSSPLLLTDPDSLSEGIAEEVDRLGATAFTVIGGEEAVSEAVVEALEAEGLVFTGRVEGETRFETAVAAAEGTLSTTALIVRGEAGEEPTQGFADALAAGGWAADAGWPVLLTQTDVLHPAVEAFLEATPTITDAIIVGGESAVGGTNRSQLEALGLEVTRVAGDSRSETAIAVAEARGFATVAAADRFIVVEGERADSYALGFPAAAHSALADAPIVLLTSGTVPAETQAWLADGTDRADEVTTGDPLFICAADPSACAGPVREALDLPTTEGGAATVELDTSAQPYATGDVLQGSATFDPDFEAGLALTGPCVDNEEAVVAEDGSFEVEITSGGVDEEGSTTCTIRYLVGYDNGTTQTGAFPIEVEPDGSVGDEGDEGPIPGIPANPLSDLIQQILDLLLP